MWKQSRYALDFFRNNDIKFWEMSNDNIRVPAGSDDWILTSEDGTTLVTYRRNNSGTGIIMEGLLGRYSVSWYNPREGGLLQDGTVTTIVGGASTEVSYGNPPDTPDNDWVILIRSL
jgi:Putative collagen-binding domain of a collagenase